MKIKLIVSTLLALLLSAGLCSSADANPGRWRRHRSHRVEREYRPHNETRVVYDDDDRYYRTDDGYYRRSYRVARRHWRRHYYGREYVGYKRHHERPRRY